MGRLFSKFLCGETIRYLIFGVLTVTVNIVSFRLLVSSLGTLAANSVAFFIAVVFAYFTNSRYVFRVPFSRKSFLEFMSMRIGTIFIDDGGMLLLMHWGWNDLMSKFAVNVIIIGLNYLLSKLFIFRKSGAKEREE